MKNKRRMALQYLLMIHCCLLLISCTSRYASESRLDVAVGELIVQGESTNEKWPIRIDLESEVWVPVDRVMHVLNFNSHVLKGTQTIHYGDTDPLYTVTADSVKALDGGRQVKLSSPPRIWDQTIYMNSEAIRDLFDIEVEWRAQQKQIWININREVHPKTINELDGMSIASNSSINRKKLLQYAQKFVGVPYEFGAENYKETGTFDCSSFIQYVHDQFDVSLPRSSGDQGSVGKRVNIESLELGDLLFFNTPGRYESNNTVGHVGMYAGPGEILHTYGEPGVTKSKLKGYWDERFLFAKRL